MIERKEYKPEEIEPRWQRRWRQDHVFSAPCFSPGRKDTYIATSMPFTTGKAHLGHIRNLTMSDVTARFRRALGESVLFSVGYDAFGLPNELVAIKTGQNPRNWVEQCRAAMEYQFERLGFSFDWSRTFLSCDEDLYRWSQWVFLRFLDRGIVFRAEGEVDWCDHCETVLASIQVSGGRCWRCEHEVRTVKRTQWFLRFTAYIEELENRLSTLSGWNEVSVEAQKTLIGKTDGVELELLSPEGDSLTVFTPYRQSIGKSAFVLISPAHPELDRWVSGSEAKDAVSALRTMLRNRSDRAADTLPVIDARSVVRIPCADRDLPIFVSAVVNERFNGGATLGIPDVDKTDAIIAKKLGIQSPQAIPVPPTVCLRSAVRYRGKDFTISRQRSWGAPIPIVYCGSCGVVPVPEEELPVVLPADIVPTGEGNPLSKHASFACCECPKCGLAARRETDTLDCLMDALWYLVPPCVPQSERSRAMFDHPEVRRWLPATYLYVGADVGGYTMNLRLFSKAIRDCGFIDHLPEGEPVENVLMHGLVLRDGKKMSKHLGNALEPDQLVNEFGSDTLRLAILYAARPEKAVNWRRDLITKCHLFLLEVWDFFIERAGDLRQRSPSPDSETYGTDPLRRRLCVWCDAAVAKVTSDLEKQAFQRAVKNVMFLFDRIRQFEQKVLKHRGVLDPEDWEATAGAAGTLLRLLAPFVPHISEELWDLCWGDGLLASMDWPKASILGSEATVPESGGQSHSHGVIDGP